MQVLETNKSNADDINRQIRLAISKVATQLAAINEESFDPDSVCNIYMDTLKILVKFPDAQVDGHLLGPLVGLVQKEQSCELVGLLGLAIFQCFLNISTFGDTVALIINDEFKELLPKLIESLEKQDMENVSSAKYGYTFSVNLLDNVVDMWTSKAFRGTLYQMSLNMFRLLQDLNKITAPVDELISLLNEGNIESRSDKIIECLDVVVNNLVAAETGEIMAIYMYNSKFLDTNNYLLNKKLSYSVSTSCQIISYIITEVFASNYFGSRVLASPQLAAMFEDNEIGLSSLKVSNKNLAFSLQMLLQTLDAPSELCNKMVLVYVMWAHNEAMSYCQLQYGKLNVHSKYNELRPNISLLSLFQLLNVHILNEVYRSQAVTIPISLEEILRQSKLPPFPKPSYFSDEYGNKNPLDFSVTEKDTGIELLSLGLIKSLKMISMFLPDDISTFLENQGAEDEDLKKKMVLNQLETLMTSFMISQYVFTHFRSIPVNYRQAGTLNVSNCLIELLKFDFDSIHLNRNFTWILLLTSMMNYATSDLRFSECFFVLMDIVLLEFSHDDILQDSAIKAIICDFVNRYGIDLNKYRQLSSYTDFQARELPRVTISVDEIRALQDSELSDTSESVDDSFSTNYLSNLSMEKSNLQADNTLDSASSHSSKQVHSTGNSQGSYSRFQAHSQPFYPEVQVRQYPEVHGINYSASSHSLASKTSNYSGGRQQSIHVDDFGK